MRKNLNKNHVFVNIPLTWDKTLQNSFWNKIGLWNKPSLGIGWRRLESTGSQAKHICYITLIPPSCVFLQKNGKILGKAFPIQMHDLAYLMTEKKNSPQINYTPDLQTHFHALLEIRNGIKPHLIPTPTPQKNASLAKNTMYTMPSSVLKAPSRQLIPNQNNISREPRPKPRKDCHDDGSEVTEPLAQEVCICSRYLSFAW